MTKRLHVLLLVMIFGALFIFGGAILTFAQQGETDSFMLEEITVTAQKRAENQQKVPITMEVVTGEDLVKLGKNDIDEILNNISSVLIGQSTDGLRVSIRGMSNDNAPFANMQVSTPTVAVNKDGVYTNRNAGNTDLFDIERVEVLFGPQSTLYASASPGGIVNLITAGPKMGTYEASGLVEYGNYELLKTEGSINVPAGDMLALRAAFSTTSRDGYLTNGGMDADTKAARLRVKFQPTDGFSFILSGELSKEGGQGFADVAGFVDQDDVENPWTATTDTPGNENLMDRKKIYANMDVDIGDIGALSVVGSYSKTTNFRTGVGLPGGPPPPPGVIQVEQRSIEEGSGNEKNIEARLASSEDSDIEWILGVNYYETRDDQSNIRYDQGNDGDDIPENVGIRWNKQETWAVYGNITYPLTDRIRATAGVRKSWDENISYNFEDPGKPEDAPNPTIEGTTMKYDDPNWKLGLEYDLGENSMIFGSWSTSYRTQAAGTAGSNFAPEELSAFNIGSKNRFFDNRLQLNASAYYYDYENYFAVIGRMETILDENNNGIRDFDDVNGNGVYESGIDMWLENRKTEDKGNLTVGDAVVYGFDIQSTLLITERDKLDISVSYLKQYFTDLIFDYYEITNWLGLPDIDYSDKEMPSAPNWAANINYSHNFSLPNGGTLTPRLEGRYSSDYFLNFKVWDVGFGEDPVTGELIAYQIDTSGIRDQEPYTIADFSMTYASPDGNWTLSAYVKNMTDYAVKRFMFFGNIQIGPPRTYGAVLSVRF